MRKLLIPAVLLAVLATACSVRLGSSDQSPGTAAPLSQPTLSGGKEPVEAVVQRVLPAVVNVTSDIFQQSPTGGAQLVQFDALDLRQQLLHHGLEAGLILGQIDHHAPVRRRRPAGSRRRHRLHRPLGRRRRDQLPRGGGCVEDHRLHVCREAAGVRRPRDRRRLPPRPGRPQDRRHEPPHGGPRLLGEPPARPARRGPRLRARAGGRTDRDDGYRLRVGPHRTRAARSARTAPAPTRASSRPTPPSTTATPAARSSTWRVR